MKVVGSDHIRQTCRLDLLGELPLACFGNDKKRPNAAACLLGDRRDLAEGEKRRTLEIQRSGVGHNRRPIRALEFGTQHLCVGNDAYAPTFGVQDLLHRAGAVWIVVKHKNAHLTGGDRRPGTHNLQYRGVATPGAEPSSSLKLIKY